MILELDELRADQIKGTKDYNKQGILPARMRFVHPNVYQGIVAIAPAAVFTDMFRSADGSLAAVQAGRGAQPPGWSGHNYGFSIDLDVDATMQILGFKGTSAKKDLDVWMAGHGWTCFRLDGKRGKRGKFPSEDWHYNHRVTIRAGEMYTVAALERKIQYHYGAQFKLDKKAIQLGLKSVKMYQGAIDGKFGPLTETAVKAFQRAWGLPVNGIPCANVQRTLAYITAYVNIQEAA